MKLAAARVFVDDLQAAQLFYQDVLQFVLNGGDAGDGYLLFDAGGVELIVEPVSDDAPAEDRSLVGRFTGLSFVVADIEARWLELVAHGVLFTSPPEAQAWGGILATFRDPSGNRFQLVQYPQ